VFRPNLAASDQFGTMRVTIVGAGPKYNAEEYYGRAFASLGHAVSYIDQYAGVENPTFTRWVSTRLGPGFRLLESLPVNTNPVARVSATRPDIVMVFKGEMLTTPTIRKLCNEFACLFFYPDNHRFPLILENRLRDYVTVFVGAHRLGFFERFRPRRLVPLQWACDPIIHKPNQLGTPPVYDVSFIGTPYPNRFRVLASIRTAEVFGPYWGPLCPGRSHGPVYGPQYVEAIAKSRINLEIHHRININADDSGMRSFEVCGSGGFVLSDYVPSLKASLPGIVTYRSIADLGEQIKHYLNNPKERAEIADELRDLCVTHHTYKNRCEEILELVH
jgi:spore maturation protein CgeB